MRGLGVRQEAQLKLIHISVYSLGNKQKLEAIMLQANYELVAITET